MPNETDSKGVSSPNQTIPATTTSQGTVPANVVMAWFGSLEPFDEVKTTWDSYIDSFL